LPATPEFCAAARKALEIRCGAATAVCSAAPGEVITLDSNLR
jgi:hypothetical protein